MNDQFRIDVIHSTAISNDLRSDIIALCSLAFEEDLQTLFSTFDEPTHVLGYSANALVSHAMWVTRWLAPGDMAPLRTAYVEAVATHPDYRRRGFAKRVMQELGRAIRSFELGALSPNEDVIDLYQDLAWESWRGPLFIRSAVGLVPTPDEQVLILQLPNSPKLDLEASLSAEWREGEVW